MKNGLLIWNVVLTAIAGYLLFVHFNSKQGSVSGNKYGAKDSFAPDNSFRMAYFEMDSIENNFQIVKDVKAEMNKKEDQINNELNKLGKNIQQRYNYYQTQAQSGKMSQQQSDAASVELKTMDDQLKNRKQILDNDYNDFVTRKMKDIKTKIEDFLKEYNRNKNYAYIVSYEQGLFYYRDTVYNITADVIKGLNEMYKNKKD
jgi:outer membrane protein